MWKLGIQSAKSPDDPVSIEDYMKQVMKALNSLHMQVFYLHFASFL